MQGWRARGAWEKMRARVGAGVKRRAPLGRRAPPPRGGAVCGSCSRARPAPEEDPEELDEEVGPLPESESETGRRRPSCSEMVISASWGLGPVEEVDIFTGRRAVLRELPSGADAWPTIGIPQPLASTIRKEKTR